MLTSLVWIAFGAVNCFYGYKAFRILLAIWGFVVGGLILANLLSNGNIIAILIGGVVGAVLMLAAYFAGVFLTGAGIGYFTAFTLLQVLRINLGSINTILSIVLAVVGGYIALKLDKFMIILATSFVGALAIILGITSLSTPLALLYPSLGLSGALTFVATVAWLVLGIVGMIVQYVGFQGLRQEYAKLTQSISTKISEEEAEGGHGIGIGEQVRVTLSVIVGRAKEYTTALLNQIKTLPQRFQEYRTSGKPKTISPSMGTDGNPESGEEGTIK